MWYHPLHVMAFLCVMLLASFTPTRSTAQQSALIHSAGAAQDRYGDPLLSADGQRINYLLQADGVVSAELNADGSVRAT